VRTFGVEEELLLVDARTHQPASVGQSAVQHADQPQQGTQSATGQTVARATAPDVTRSLRQTTEARAYHVLTVELQREQIEVVGPPCTTLTEQLAAIRKGRALADTAARAVGGRVVALATSVFAGLPSLVPERRYRQIRRHVGLLAVRHLTCGFHVHVEVVDRDEGVAVLDRIRIWLPVLLALSVNSPFWYGVDSGFASYRYQAMTRWPTAGPCDIFGSAKEYDRQARALLRSGVALDDDMLYFDARLSAHFPTVEVRVTDICMDPTHAAVLAALVRALVETAGRQWRDGQPPQPVTAAELRAWTWQASRFGTDGLLISPATGSLTPPGRVVAEMLALLRPVLDEYEEADLVETVVSAILKDGSGTRQQRQAYARRHEATDVVDTALRVGTPHSPDQQGSATARNTR
jgi:carboxylate-amine ligase